MKLLFFVCLCICNYAIACQPHEERRIGDLLSDYDFSHKMKLDIQNVKENDVIAYYRRGKWEYAAIAMLPINPEKGHLYGLIQIKVGNRLQVNAISFEELYQLP